MYLKTGKAMNDKPTSSHHTEWEEARGISTEIRNQTRMPTLTITNNRVLKAFFQSH